jgi:hypothetical protein
MDTCSGPAKPSTSAGGKSVFSIIELDEEDNNDDD